MTRVVLTRHAIRRYQERIKPALDFDQAQEDLCRLLNLCTNVPTTEPPYWLRGDGDACLEVSPGIWLVLLRNDDGWVATTVLVDGSFSPERRAAKSKRRRERRRARYAKSKDRRINRQREPDREAA